jgi:putative hydrolase of the HAD superfamily
LLIIFDLDDTLIDTSGCITHYKLEEALNAMVAAGLALPDFSEALSLLRRLDSSAESARTALAEFIELLGAEKKYFEIGVREAYDTLSFDLPIFPLEGALDLLIDLSQQHQLALVTVGNPAQQMEKLKKAGIDSTIFSKISVTEDRNKKPHYQTIVDELGYSPAGVLVCGDRIYTDLIPARELGFKTVQMQWGRGLNAAGNKGDVDYRISEIRHLKDIVNSLHTFSSF